MASDQTVTLTVRQLGQLQRRIRQLNEASVRSWRCRNRRRKLHHGRRAFRLFHAIEQHITLVPIAALTVEVPSKGEPSYE